MIRCDIVKGKTSQNLVQQGWDAQPRNADGFVLDLGNIGNNYLNIILFEYYLNIILFDYYLNIILFEYYLNII